MESKNVRGAILLLITSFIWGSAFVAQSLGNSIGPFTFNAVRNYVGFLFLLPVIWLISKGRKYLEMGTPPKPGLGFIGGGVICGIALFGASSLQQMGLQFTSAGKAGFLTALYIVIVPVLGLLLKRRVPLKIWISVVIAGFGTYLLSVNEGFRIELGDLYVILGAVIFSVHILFIDRYSAKTDAIKLSATQFLTCAILSTVISVTLEAPTLAGILTVWGPILYAGVVSSGIAYTLQILGQKDTPPTIAALIMSLESVFAVFAGWVMLGEELAPKELFGCALVFVAVILAQIPMGKRKKKLSI